MFTEGRNADGVKKVRMKGEGDEKPPFFLISLIKHKTKVEYCMHADIPIHGLYMG